MGFDYGNHHVFVGDRDAQKIRQAIIDCIHSISNRFVAQESEGDRSIVVGAPDRWIFVGDSTSRTEDGDPVAFDKLAIELSKITPTINVLMSDSAVVHLLMYVDGKLVDKFGNGTFPFFRFKSDEESKPFQGDIEKWKSFLLSPNDSQTLRQIWKQDGNTRSIVRETARLFGIHPESIQVGYSIFDEAEEIKYTGWLDDDTINLDLFDEFHLVSLQPESDRSSKRKHYRFN